MSHVRNTRLTRSSRLKNVLRITQNHRFTGGLPLRHAIGEDIRRWPLHRRNQGYITVMCIARRTIAFFLAWELPIQYYAFSCTQHEKGAILAPLRTKVV